MSVAPPTVPRPFLPTPNQRRRPPAAATALLLLLAQLAVVDGYRPRENCRE